MPDPTLRLLGLMAGIGQELAGLADEWPPSDALADAGDELEALLHRLHAGDVHGVRQTSERLDGLVARTRASVPAGPLLDREATGYGRPETGAWPASTDTEAVAWGRAESAACERGTPGCSVLHTCDSECATW